MFSTEEEHSMLMSHMEEKKNKKKIKCNCSFFFTETLLRLGSMKFNTSHFLSFYELVSSPLNKEVRRNGRRGLYSVSVFMGYDMQVSTSCLSDSVLLEAEQ